MGRSIHFESSQASQKSHSRPKGKGKDRDAAAGLRMVLPAVLHPIISAGVEPSGCAGVPAARALTVVAEGATADEIDRRSGNRGREANTSDEEDSEEFADHEISRAHGAAAPCAGARAAIKKGAGKEEKRSRTACHTPAACRFENSSLATPLVHRHGKIAECL